MITSLWFEPCAFPLSPFLVLPMVSLLTGMFHLFFEQSRIRDIHDERALVLRTEDLGSIQYLEKAFYLSVTFSFSFALCYVFPSVPALFYPFTYSFIELFINTA